MFNLSIFPNLITIFNLFFGFWATLMVVQGKYLAACWMIICAAVFDGLDGKIARLVKKNSAFGIEVDSLADMVSFGVAPSLLLYAAVLEPYGWIGILLAFLPLLLAAFRLARFNLQAKSGGGRRRFIGLPSPSSALILVSFFIYSRKMGVLDTPMWFSLIPAVSLLMISPFPYRRMPVINSQGWRQPALGHALIISIAAALIIEPAVLLFPAMLLYMLLGPIEWAEMQLRRYRSNRRELTEPRVVGRSRQRFNRRRSA